MRWAGEEEQFLVSASPLPSAHPTLICLFPADALAAEHYPNSTLYNTSRSAAAGCFVRQTSSCQPIMGGCLFVFPCHLPVVVITFEPRQERRQEEQVEHVSLALSLSPMSLYTAEMLHRHLRNQEITTDWDGQHPVAVGCVWEHVVVYAMHYMYLSVLHRPTSVEHEAWVWGHAAVAGHKSTLWHHGNVTKPL